MEILFFPIVLGVVYLLPFLGVTFSTKNNKRWLGHWLVTLFLVNVVSCILSWALDDWMVQFFIIALAVGLLLTFSNEKVTILLIKADEVFGLVDSGVQVVKAQVDMIKEKVLGSMRQQGLV